MNSVQIFRCRKDGSDHKVQPNYQLLAFRRTIYENKHHRSVRNKPSGSLCSRRGKRLSSSACCRPSGCIVFPSLFIGRHNQPHGGHFNIYDRSGCVHYSGNRAIEWGRNWKQCNNYKRYDELSDPFNEYTI
jgi:hypothetical protein